MGSDTGDPYPPTTELDEEEHAQAFEEHGVHREEVGGDDMSSLGPQELAPRGSTSTTSWPETVFVQDPGDRARGQPEAEVYELTLNTSVSPPRALAG